LAATRGFESETLTDFNSLDTRVGVGGETPSACITFSPQRG